jgi:hypothetical protein
MLEVLRLVPKLGVQLMAACKAKNVQVEFRRTAAGYSHTYFNANNIPLGILSEFPSDLDIAQAATIAYDEANTLWDLLGYYHASSDNPSPSHRHQTAPDPHEDTDHSDEPADVTSPNFECSSLQEALHSGNDTISGMDSHAKSRLDEYSYAAACLNFQDQEKM